MTEAINHGAIGLKLFEALRTLKPITPLSDEFPEMTIDDAYQISLAFLDARLAGNNEKVIGKKIGVTSKPVQEMLGVFQPDFGFLTDAMIMEDNVVHTGQLIAPRAEAEIGFRLKKNLHGPGVTGQDILDATDYVQTCFEIVDSRILDWRIKIQDTVADNASCGVFVLGEEQIDPRAHDLSALKVIVEKNGKFSSEGFSSSVQGSPENAVAWLANTLGAYGIPFEAGEIILSGSMVPLEPVVPGDEMTISIDGFGSCHASFK